MYPAQSLVVIAPIIFIVLMVAIPIVGYFMGWKRALFWGTGNLIFYVIGFVIWLFAGKAIGEWIGPILQKSISALKDADLSKIATSVVAPIFFIIIMFVGNIILLINYFAWYTRVARIRREDKEAKGPAPIGAPVMKYEFTSRIIGAVSLPVLLLPSTFAFTQGLFYATTSKATRAKNSFANNLYNGLDKINNKFKWFSYYKDSAADFDALWAGLSLNDTKVEGIDWRGWVPEDNSLTTAIKTVFTEGFGDMYDAALGTVEQPGTAEDVKQVLVNQMIPVWNAIVEQQHNAMEPIFASTNAVELIKDIFGIDPDPSKGKIGQDEFNLILRDGTSETDKGGVITEAIELYKNLDPDEKFTTLSIPQSSISNMADTIADFYPLQEDEADPWITEEIKEQYNKRMTELVNLLFTAR